MAAPAVDISVLGDKGLQRALSKLPKNIQRKVVRQSLRRGAKPVLQAAKSLVPVKSGTLKKSLKVAAASSVGRKELGVVVRTGDRAELGISPEDKYFYPAAVEFGHGQVPPHSYLRRALDTQRSTAIAETAADMGPRIEAEARKLRDKKGGR